MHEGRDRSSHSYAHMARDEAWGIADAHSEWRDVPADAVGRGTVIGELGRRDAISPVFLKNYHELFCAQSDRAGRRAQDPAFVAARR